MQIHVIDHQIPCRSLDPVGDDLLPFLRLNSWAIKPLVPGFCLLLNAMAHSLSQEIQSLLTNWKGPDLTSYGELVLEGTFRIQRAKNERTLFLFDKLLLITKKRDDTFTYKAHILVGLHAGHEQGLRSPVPFPPECASPSLLSLL